MVRTTVGWALACAAALALPAGAASTEWLVHPKVCKRAHLSDETRAFCAGIVGLSGRDLFKAMVLENLRRTNQPPLAALEVERVLPRRVDLDASGASDEDGFPVHYTFQLFDDDTGEILAGPLTAREPHASLESHQDLPPNLLARVVVEDDERATDTTELAIPLGATTTNCSNTFFACSTSSSQTTCTPSSTNSQFSTDDLLDAAQRCDLSLTKQTALVITAAGGKGGTGADVWPYDGGSGGKGGAARMGTRLANLDSTYGAAGTTTYCYGLGQKGGHGDTYSAAGGAATLLRTCQNVSQTSVTGVLLIAGGGGGGGAASLGASGRGGGSGGIAISSTGGPGEGAGARGGGSGGYGGSGGTGGAGAPKSGIYTGAKGADGVGGKGGSATDWGTAGWTQGNPQVTGNSGQGGSQESSGGGSGAGGYGGGGSGVTQNNPAGGGGGGSYAAASSISAGGAPSSNGGGGYLQFTFQP